MWASGLRLGEVGWGYRCDREGWTGDGKPGDPLLAPPSPALIVLAHLPGPSHGGCPVKDYSQTPATPSQTGALTSVTEINIVTDKLGGKSDV